MLGQVVLPLSDCHTGYIFPAVLWSLHSLLLLSEHAHTTFHCVVTCSFYKYPYELSLQHCRVFCILFKFLSQFFTTACYVLHTFTFFSHTIYTGDFHWSYRCGTSYSLSWLPIFVRHTTMLLSQPLNHLLITIAKLFCYQLSPFSSELAT